MADMMTMTMAELTDYLLQQYFIQLEKKEQENILQNNTREYWRNYNRVMKIGGSDLDDFEINPLYHLPRQKV